MGQAWHALYVAPIAWSKRNLPGLVSTIALAALLALPPALAAVSGAAGNIHSHDLVPAFREFFQAPRSGAVYNLGGNRHSHCSMLEAIALCEEISGRQLNWTYVEDNRIGDHIWWVSDVGRFQHHFPRWQYQYDLRAILQEIHAATT